MKVKILYPSTCRIERHKCDHFHCGFLISRSFNFPFFLRIVMLFLFSQTLFLLLLQVRSRSLTQLDALSSSMLNRSEHYAEGKSSQQQAHHVHHHQQRPQLQHYPHSVESNRLRFLAPGHVTPIEGSNGARRKLSRSQVNKLLKILSVFVM